MGEPPPILFVSCFCRGVQRTESADRPSNLPCSSPVPIEKASSVWRYGNYSSFTNNVDLSATDGINLEHKKEQCQSSKDARPARRRRQLTSRRRVRDSADQHGQGGGGSRHQPTLAERVGTTHQENTTPPGDTTGSKRLKPSYSRRVTPRPSSRSG